MPIARSSNRKTRLPTAWASPACRPSSSPTNISSPVRTTRTSSSASSTRRNRKCRPRNSFINRGLFMKIHLATAALAAVMLPALSAAQTAPRPDQIEFRALYKELVETNTELSDGNCTIAAAKMAARLKAAGYPDADIHPFQAEGHPKEGGLVAVLHGNDPKARPMLLLAHIDVVEAKRADWQRDPFTLVEENGYFYGRGSSDDKASASVW